MASTPAKTAGDTDIPLSTSIDDTSSLSLATNLVESLNPFLESQKTLHLRQLFEHNDTSFDVLNELMVRIHANLQYFIHQQKQNITGSHIPQLRSIFDVLTHEHPPNLDEFHKQLINYVQTVQDIDNQQSLLTTYCELTIQLLQERQKIFISKLKNLHHKQQELLAEAQNLTVEAAALVDSASDPSEQQTLDQIERQNKINRKKLDRLQNLVEHIETLSSVPSGSP